MSPRRRYSVSASAALAACVGAYVYYQHRTPSVSAADQWAMLDRYCVGCHNDVERAGDLAFDRLDPSRPARGRGGLGNRDPQAARRTDAAARRAAARRRRASTRFVGLARGVARRRGAQRAESRRAGAAPLEPRRVRERRARPARPARRRDGAPARRRLERRLRQHRERAQRLAGAAAELRRAPRRR